MEETKTFTIDLNKDFTTEQKVEMEYEIPPNYVATPGKIKKGLLQNAMQLVTDPKRLKKILIVIGAFVLIGMSTSIYFTIKGLVILTSFIYNLF